MRAGCLTLKLLSGPRIATILHGLSAGPIGQLELRRAAGTPPQSTLRNYLRSLEEIGVVHKRLPGQTGGGALEYELTAAGRDLLAVVDELEDWLSSAPEGPLELGADPAKAAVKGLIDAWSYGVLGALAEGPHSLTELDKQVPLVSYPTLERCLETMRLADQLEVGTRGSRGTPHAATDWLRRGLAPLAVGARWEHRHGLEEAAPITRVDIFEGATLLGALIELPAHLSGTCELSVRSPDTLAADRALGILEARNGRFAFTDADPQDEPDAWASGEVKAWFLMLIEGDTADLTLGGDQGLAAALIDHIHATLFGSSAHLA